MKFIADFRRFQFRENYFKQALKCDSIITALENLGVFGIALAPKMLVLFQKAYNLKPDDKNLIKILVLLFKIWES